jgi:hypothetical protein
MTHIPPILIYGPPHSGKKTKAVEIANNQSTIDCALRPILNIQQLDESKIIILEHVDMLQNINQLLNVIHDYNFIFTSRRIQPIMKLARQCKIIFTKNNQIYYPPEITQNLHIPNLKLAHNAYFLYGLGVDEKWICEYVSGGLAGGMT